MAPWGLARDIIQEGLRIPPVRLYKEEKLQEEVFELLLANVRLPDERRGDLLAQCAANRRGTKRLVDLARKHGPDETQRWMDRLIDYTETMTRRLIESIPGRRLPV